MNIAAAGNAYTNITPGAGYPNPLSVRPMPFEITQSARQNTPQSPSAAAVMFWSGDGDTVELSLPGSQYYGSTAMPQVSPMPAQNAPFETQAPEIPSSGLLDSLKPEGQCQTCANRKYVDGSDDPSVSYQTPTKINPGMAGVAVAAHEREHVSNEQANAVRDDRQIVSQTVTLKYDCCPECGRSYVSGGTTRTMSVGKKENDVKTPQNQPSSETE